MAEVGQIFEYLNELAPVELKMDFDNVGLLVGNAEAKVEKCLVALDITDEVITSFVSLINIVNKKISRIKLLRDDIIYFINNLYISMESLIGLKWLSLLLFRYIVPIFSSVIEISSLLVANKTLVSYSYLSPFTFNK